MNKKTSIIKFFIVGLIFLGVGMFSITVFAGHWSDESSHIEDKQTTNIVHIDEVDENQEEVIEQVENEILNVTINSGGYGSVSWSNIKNIYDDDNSVAMFFITPKGKVLFEDDEMYPIPDDEDFLKEIETEITSEFEANKRAIYFLGGEMNKEKTEGVLEWQSHQRFNGDLRFTVNEKGEIIVNESDWNALPETDEKTTDDFYHSAEKVINNWGNYTDITNINF